MLFRVSPLRTHQRCVLVLGTLIVCDTLSRLSTSVLCVLSRFGFYMLLLQTLLCASSNLNFDVRRIYSSCKSMKMRSFLQIAQDLKTKPQVHGFKNSTTSDGLVCSATDVSFFECTLIFHKSSSASVLLIFWTLLPCLYIMKQGSDLSVPDLIDTVPSINRKQMFFCVNTVLSIFMDGMTKIITDSFQYEVYED